MEIKQLRYFVEICRCKSFSRAASICYISSQGMSMSMMRLEEELGCNLFVRSPRGVVLTPQAEFLLPKAKKILAIVDECDSYFRSESTDEATISIAFSHGTIEEFAGDVIKNFQARYPEIKIQVRECPDLDSDDAVINEESEMALTVGPLPEGRFASKLLFSSSYALIVSKDHPLAQRESISLHELKNLPLVVMRGGVRTYSCLRNACIKAGFEPRVSTFADNVLLVFYMATSGQNFGISTQHLFRRLNPPGLCAIPIESADFKWNVYAIKLKNSTLSPPVKLFWQALAAKADKTLSGSKNK